VFYVGRWQRRQQLMVEDVLDEWDMERNILITALLSVQHPIRGLLAL
jgi:hypothetical protein